MTSPAANARNGGDTGNVAARRIIMEQAVEPAPLRSFSVARDGLPKGSGTWVPFERRYRGQGLLERRCRSRFQAYTAGSALIAGVGTGQMPWQSPDDSQPTPLAQQILRLEYGIGGSDCGTGSGISTTAAVVEMVAIVRVVLEPRYTSRCDCDCALSPSADIQGEHDRRKKQERCEVRGVVRVEAYLPSSSKTLSLRVRVQPATTTASSTSIPTAAKDTSSPADDQTLLCPIKVAAAASVKGGAATAAEISSPHGPAYGDQGRRKTKGEGQLVQPAGARHKEECRSRKRRRRELREARDAEALKDAEAPKDTSKTVAAVQEASTGVSICSSQARQQHDEPSAAEAPGDQGRVLDDLADDGQHKQSRAFSMLLIRANVVVPIRRLHIGSGSWREEIGELLGCPRGQELRMVREITRWACSAQQ